MSGLAENAYNHHHISFLHNLIARIMYNRKITVKDYLPNNNFTRSLSNGPLLLFFDSIFKQINCHSTGRTYAMVIVIYRN